eukprot:scaffold282078_cov79-Cyclotella_meneghiniana.AAC.1
MTPFNDDDVVFQEDVFRMNTNGVEHEEEAQAASSPRKPSVLPKVCSDGRTLGFDNWFHLKDAISEANALAAEDFLRWNKYLVASLNNPDLEEPVFDVPDPFVICPGAKLNQRHPPRMSIWSWLTSFFIDTPNQYKPNNNKLSSIYINAEDITIQCDRCTIDLPGTHFSFGPHANAWIKGITFRGATTSSLTLHHHGATASFEDCYWLYNSGGIVASKNNPVGTINLEGSSVGGTMNGGAVADVNSTSSITFYRCCIDDQRQNPRRANVGAGLANVPGMNPSPPLGHGHNGGGGLVIIIFAVTIWCKLGNDVIAKRTVVISFSFTGNASTVETVGQRGMHIGLNLLVKKIFFGLLASMWTGEG